MALNYKFISLSSFFFFLLFCVVNGQDKSIHVFNVKDYGAVANGQHNDTEAFDLAWREACVAEGEKKVRVPEGCYFVGPMTFQGPCNGSMMVEVKGLLLAPTNLSVYNPTQSPATWLEFRHLNNIHLYGDGVFDGQGHSAWSHPYIQRPYSLGFRYVSNGTVRGVSLVNGKSLHLLIYECDNFNVDALTINSPADSPNTDGIHVAQSTNVVVANSTIGSGDDCIAFLEGAANVNVSNISCGPGHGISVGSLGSYRNTVAIKLTCSKDYPCSDVELANINLEYIGKKKPEPNWCANVWGNSTGTVQPPPCICWPAIIS